MVTSQSGEEEWADDKNACGLSLARYDCAANGHVCLHPRGLRHFRLTLASLRRAPGNDAAPSPASYGAIGFSKYSIDLQRELAGNMAVAVSAIGAAITSRSAGPSIRRSTSTSRSQVPHHARHDGAAVAKNFSLAGRKQVQIKGEVINLFNQVQARDNLVGRHPPYQDLSSLACSGTPPPGQTGKNRATSPGTGHAIRMFVINFFMAGPEMVRWELTAVESNGPFRLTVHHAHGVIVEYFETSSAALMREQELEDLLIAARGTSK